MEGTQETMATMLQNPPFVEVLRTKTTKEVEVHRKEEKLAKLEEASKTPLYHH